MFKLDKQSLLSFGAPEAVYRDSGLFTAMEQVLHGGLFSISGIQSLGTKSFCSIFEAGDEGRKAMLEEVRGLAGTLK